LATKSGYKAIIQLLLNTSKVKVDLRDNYSQMLLSLATKSGHETHEAVVQLLLDAGKVML